MTPENVVKRFGYYHAIHNQVHKTFYKTKDGGWTENEGEGDWKQLSANPGNRVCDIRYEDYFVVDGKRIDDLKEAVNEHILVQYRNLILTDLLFNNKCIDCLYCPADKQCKLSGEIRKVRKNTKGCLEFVKKESYGK